jgi:hypothetical protein
MASRAAAMRLWAVPSPSSHSAQVHWALVACDRQAMDPEVSTTNNTRGATSVVPALVST